MYMPILVYFKYYSGWNGWAGLHEMQGKRMHRMDAGIDGSNRLRGLHRMDLTDYIDLIGMEGNGSTLCNPCLAFAAIQPSHSIHYNT